MGTVGIVHRFIATSILAVAASATAAGPAVHVGREPAADPGTAGQEVRVTSATTMVGRISLRRGSAGTSLAWGGTTTDGVSTTGAISTATGVTGQLRAWTEESLAGRRVVAQFTDARREREPFPLTRWDDMGGSLRHPDLAVEWSGTTFGVAYLVRDSSSLMFVHVDADGSAERVIELAAEGAMWPRILAWRGEFLVAWLDGVGRRDVRAALIGRDGVHREFRVTEDQPAGAFSMASLGDRILFVHDVRDDQDLDEAAVVLDPASGRTDRFALAASPDLEFDPSVLVLDETAWLVARGYCTPEGSMGVAVDRVADGRAREWRRFPTPGATEIVGPELFVDRGVVTLAWSDDRHDPFSHRRDVWKITFPLR